MKHFVKKYEQMPVLQMEEIGYGFGKREYERLNCVRAILGETQDKVEEEILELCCNLDDMTSEEIGMQQSFDQRRRIGCLHILHSDEEKTGRGFCLHVCAGQSRKSIFYS